MKHVFEAHWYPLTQAAPALSEPAGAVHSGSFLRVCHCSQDMFVKVAAHEPIAFGPTRTPGNPPTRMQWAATRASHEAAVPYSNAKSADAHVSIALQRAEA
jgi:hypothetical protein